MRLNDQYICTILILMYKLSNITTLCLVLMQALLERVGRGYKTPQGSYTSLSIHRVTVHFTW